MPGAETQRLRRRLDRERASRLEAEAIAERGLRDLYEKQRQLELLEAVAVAANQAASIRDALQFAVTRLCEFTHWPMGHAFLAKTTAEGRYLQSTAIWHNASSSSSDDFRRETEGTIIQPGFGLPGRVLRNGAPAWIISVEDDENFMRHAAAKAAGIASAFAFPVLVGDEVVAVVEFYSLTRLQPEETLLWLMAQIGTQLGRVVERERAKDKLVHDASHDALTGLPNRSLFLDRLTRAIAQKRRHPEINFAVLFIDLDRFKVVNDSLGHLAGDLLIAEVAARFMASLRQTDIVSRPNAMPPISDKAGLPENSDTLARLGGDEFTILLDDLGSLSDAVRVAERILGALAKPFLLNGQEAYVGASIGIASSATPYATADEVMRDADLAMYRAKALGKGRYEVFDQTMHTVAVQRLALESDLRRALQHDEFVLHYQPIVNLRDEAVTGFEALVRWQRPGHGLVYPGDFIEVAEDTGIILFLGMWVLREACRTVRRWHLDFPREKPLTISVNISARQFAQPDLVRQIRRIIDETGIQPTSLRLELTESVTMANAERAISVLESLRDLGIRISIDDFGTGYSSLSYLHRLPLDVLKIDRSFVTQMNDANEGLQIVNTIMHLAQNLDMEVIAEGVETEAHVKKLRALGCANGQGYFFSRPVPEATIRKLLEDSGG
jgi:predicted signal transduction protein with EAL and GGDEF domain